MSVWASQEMEDLAWRDGAVLKNAIPSFRLRLHSAFGREEASSTRL
jgi:hypothetical protein